MRMMRSMLFFAIAFTIMHSDAYSAPSGDALIRAMRAEQGLSQEEMLRVIQRANGIDSREREIKYSKEEKINYSSDGYVVTPVAQLSKPQKRQLGMDILKVVREIDTAIDRWAMERGKKDGDLINTNEAATYYKWPGKDLLGNPFKIGKIGMDQVVVAYETQAALAGAGIDWGVYAVTLPPETGVSIVSSCAAYGTPSGDALVSAMRVERFPQEVVQRIIQRANDIDSGEQMLKYSSDGFVITPIAQISNSQKRQLGLAILDTARAMDASICEWAIFQDKKAGDQIDTNGAAAYYRYDKYYYDNRNKWPEKDLLGNPFIIGKKIAVNQIMIAKETKEALAEGQIDWGDY